MPSPAFERFQFSFFEDPTSARDGLDAASLAELDGKEKVRAEDMLLSQLPDTRAVIGLGVLRSARAETRLAALLEGEPSSLAAPYLAKALWRIRPDPRWLAALVEALETGDDWPHRMEAALALVEIHDAAAAPSLVRALDDGEPLVRHHAARALLALYGLPPDSKDPSSMIYRVMANDPVRRESGKRDILGAISGRSIAP